MKNKLYNIIYLSGLLIDNQANVDSDIYEMNNTIIPEDIIIPKENNSIPKEENIIPETVINQEINIDMDLLSNSKLVFVIYYSVASIFMFFFLLIIFFILVVYIFMFYYNKKNIKGIKAWKFLYYLSKPIIIPILSYIVIAIINTNKYTSKYMKQNALFKSWCLYMGIMLIYLLIVTDWTYNDALNLIDLLNVFNQSKNKFIAGIKSIIATFIFNNITLLLFYSMLKVYYQKNPIKYKEKRDYINTLNNNITPVNVLDNNLDII